MESDVENYSYFESVSEQATTALGRCIAEALSPGDIVALVGNLGAGKTRLVQAIASGLDVPSDVVNSPTFTLVQEYAGRLMLRHCDTYRLRSPEEFLDLGLDELLAEDGVALIEWADRVSHLLPKDRLMISIEIISPSERRFEISASGPRSQRLLQRIRQGSLADARDADK